MVIHAQSDNDAFHLSLSESTQSLLAFSTKKITKMAQRANLSRLLASFLGINLQLSKQKRYSDCICCRKKLELHSSHLGTIFS